jgi:simple sugar transport system ATP-binding protein
VINIGVLSGTLVTAEASLDEIGLLMGGLHGMDEHVPRHEGDVAHVA